MKILYVEDNPLDVELTRRALRRKDASVQIDHVSSQAEALTQLTRVSPEPYDIVLIDRRLPDGDGLSLLTHIRGRSLPVAVILITGQGDEELAVAALKAGANDYIVKRDDYLDHLLTILKSADDNFRNQSVRFSRPLQVLYADHNNGDIDLTSRHFTNHAPHIHLHITHDARSALRELESHAQDFDLLMVDYRLPGMNGIELIKEVHQIREMQIPIVLVTGQGDEDIALQSIKLGAADYVPKNPGYLYQLPGILEDAFHRNELVREQEALRESESRYRSLFMDSPVALIEQDFSAVKSEIETLQKAGIQNFREYFVTHPEVITLLVGKLKITSINRAAIKLYKAVDTNFLRSNLYINLPPKSRDLLIEEMVWIAESDRKTTFAWVGPHTNLRNEQIYVEVHWSISPGFEKTLQRVMVSIEDRTSDYEKSAQIDRQLQRLNSLRQIDAAISSSLNLDVTLGILVRQVIEQLKVDSANIYLYNPIKTQLELFNLGSMRTNKSNPPSIPLGKGFAGKAAEDLRLVAIPDIQSARSNVSSRLSLLDAEIYSGGFGSGFAVPLSAKGSLKGVLEVYLKHPFHPDHEWLEFFQTLAGQAAIAIDNYKLFTDLQRTNDELIQAWDATIEGWAKALAARDSETWEHTIRAVDLSIKLAESMGMTGEQLVQVRRGATLHDIGKMQIPDVVLQKKEPLSPEEWLIMKKHPQNGFDLISPITFLRPAAAIPYYHHEKWDGSGYPHGLAGERIPLMARIFAICDVYAALTTDRPYRAAWSHKKSVDFIRDQVGKHFDPQVAEKFFRILGES